MGTRSGRNTRTANSLFASRPSNLNTVQESPDLPRALQEYEDSIRGLSYERTQVYNIGTGEPIFEKGGDQSSIYFSLREFLQLRDSVMTHNHPILDINGAQIDGGPFSPMDISLARSADIRVMRAVTRDYTYVMERPTTGWSNRFVREASAEQDAVMRAATAENQRLYRLYGGNNFNVTQHVNRMFDDIHETMSVVSARHGVRYERIPRGS